MDADAYRAFRLELDRQLSGPSGEPPWEVRSADPIAPHLARVLQEARRTAQAISACLDDAAALDRNKYEFVLSMLDRILSFDEWVLAEYTYELAGGAHPGIRLLLEVGPVGRQISVVLFEDTRRWQVDEAGRKVSYELLALLLDQPAPVPHVAAESAEYFDGAWDWRLHLREALCLPVRLLD